MPPRRVVLDTNVLISAALMPASVPARLMQALLQSSRLVFAEPTFAELQTRLWRPKFDRYISVEARRRLLIALTAVAEWVRLPDGPAPRLSRDADDDVFIQAALAAGADWLVSGDADLLDVPGALGLCILSPRQALDRCHHG